MQFLKKINLKKKKAFLCLCILSPSVPVTDSVTKGCSGGYQPSCCQPGSALQPGSRSDRVCARGMPTARHAAKQKSNTYHSRSMGRCIGWATRAVSVSWFSEGVPKMTGTSTAKVVPDTGLIKNKTNSLHKTHTHPTHKTHLSPQCSQYRVHSVKHLLPESMCSICQLCSPFPLQVFVWYATPWASPDAHRGFQWKVHILLTDQILLVSTWLCFHWPYNPCLCVFVYISILAATKFVANQWGLDK